VTQARLGHRDESDRDCEVHPVDLAQLLHYAAIGARAASFNHDIASKIQGVMMALDEVAELASGELKESAETAQSALVELNQLLQQNRALTKTPVNTRIALHELMLKAAQRVGVTLRGEKAAHDVEVAIPLLTQALAMALDAAAGIERRRTMELLVKVDGTRIELALPIAPSATPAGEALAIAAWIVERDRGQLRCGASAISISLPIAQ
jgi:hypothetical protein